MAASGSRMLKRGEDRRVAYSGLSIILPFGRSLFAEALVKDRRALVSKAPDSERGCLVLHSSSVFFVLFFFLLALLLWTRHFTFLSHRIFPPGIKGHILPYLSYRMGIRSRQHIICETA